MSIRWKLLTLVLGIIVILTGLAMFATAWGNRKLIEMQSQQIARTVAEQVIVERKYFTTSVAEPLAQSDFAPKPEGGHKVGDRRVPLPAEFVRLVADSVSEFNEDYRYRLVSRWNINEAGGLNDPFLIQAFDDLLEQEAQAKASGQLSASTPYSIWMPIWEVKKKEGHRILTYVKADPAVSSSCVSCHNYLEQQDDVIAKRVASNVDTGRVFELNDLMGAIVVEVDLEEAGAQGMANMRAMLIAAFAVAVLVGLLAFWRSETITAPLREFSVAAKAIAAGDTSKRISIRTNDELGDMAATFNEMTEQIEEDTLELQRLNADQERLIEERTGELRDANKELEARNMELQRSLELVDRLSGLLPICAECKNVRNDDGYWQQVESYVTDHSDVTFSHSVCPDCWEKLYPDIEQP